MDNMAQSRTSYEDCHIQVEYHLPAGVRGDRSFRQFLNRKNAPIVKNRNRHTATFALVTKHNIDIQRNLQMSTINNMLIVALFGVIVSQAVGFNEGICRLFFSDGFTGDTKVAARLPRTLQQGQSQRKLLGSVPVGELRVASRSETVDQSNGCPHLTHWIQVPWICSLFGLHSPTLSGHAVGWMKSG